MEYATKQYIKYFLKKKKITFLSPGIVTELSHQDTFVLGFELGTEDYCMLYHQSS